MLEVFVDLFELLVRLRRYPAARVLLVAVLVVAVSLLLVALL